jgi:hypothetical protein
MTILPTVTAMNRNLTQREVARSRNSNGIITIFINLLSISALTTCEVLRVWSIVNRIFVQISLSFKASARVTWKRLSVTNATNLFEILNSRRNIGVIVFFALLFSSDMRASESGERPLNEEQVRCRKQAEMALSLKAPTYSHGIFGSNAANSFVLEEFKGKRREALQVALKKWTEYDPREAARWAEEILDLSLRHESLTLCLTAWAKIDPIHALEWAVSLYAPDDRVAVEATVNQWLAQDHDGALNYINATPELFSEVRCKDLIRASFISCLSKRDPIQALSWIEAVNKEGETPNWKNYYVKGWADKEPEEAYKWAVSNKVSAHIWWSGAKAWIKREPKRLVPWLKANENSDGVSAVIKYMEQGIIHMDPELCQWLADLPPPSAKLIDDDSYLFRISSLHLANELAKQNPEKAMAKALSIENESLRDEAIKSVASLWAYQQPEKAIAWFNTLENGMRHAVLASVVAGYGERDWHAALTWIEGLSQADISDQVRGNIQVDFDTAMGATIFPGDTVVYYDDWRKDALRSKLSELDLAYLSLFPIIAYCDYPSSQRLAEKIKSNTNKAAYNAIVQAINCSRVDSEPSIAPELLANLFAKKNSDDVFFMLFILAKSSPGLAFTWTQEHASAHSVDLSNVTTMVLTNWAQNHPQQMLHQTTKTVTSANYESWLSAIRDLIKLSPIDMSNEGSHYAARWASALEPSATRNEVLSEISGRWASYDRTSALAWVRSLSPRDSMMAALAGIAHAMFYSKDVDFKTSFAFLSSIDDGPEKIAVQQEIVEQYIKIDAINATVWLSEFPPIAERETMMSVAIYSLNKVEDDQLVLTGLRNLTPILQVIRGKFPTLSELVKRLTKFQPEAMADWAVELQDGDIKINAIHTVFKAWLVKNPSKAEDWFRSFDQSIRDRVMQMGSNDKQFYKPSAQDVNDF